jgi:uncharacterized protein (UPF0261 family)
MSKPQLSDTDYGYNGLLRIINNQDIDINEWITERLDKERGGIKFMLPNAEGEIYLTWGDIYHIKLTTVHTKKTFDSIVNLNELQQMLVMLEEQRQRTKKSIADMLMKAFSKDEEE